MGCRSMPIFPIFQLYTSSLTGTPMLQAAHVYSRTDTFASQPIPAGVVAEYSGISGCMHRCDSTSVMTESQSSAGQKVHFPLLSVSSFMDCVNW